MSEELHEKQILSISQLNRRARILLETHIPLVWVRGEISNLARPGSGHWYFSLKDDSAQIRCAMFRNRNQLARIQPRNGDQVMVRGRISLYEARGDYQLIVEHIEADGAGLLQQRLEALKEKLRIEGLFDPAHKRPAPPFPRRIGVVTSPTGAAVRDILQVSARRHPWIDIVIYPTAVQGREATDEIVRAITRANRHRSVDVLIVARGGGSIEDLWAFNEEAVARAIHASDIPVISAVGHETDFTIADLTADVRAPTPSAAAEIAGPDGDALAGNLARIEKRLAATIGQQMSAWRQDLNHLAKRLRSPADRLREQSQHLDHLEIRLVRAWEQNLGLRKSRLASLDRQLAAGLQNLPVERYQNRVSQLSIRLRRAALSLLSERGRQLQGLTATLNAVSPLSTLERGYAIVRDRSRQVIPSTQGLHSGDDIEVVMQDGSAECVVRDIRRNRP